ncbi:hypothetical protein GN958_ATG16507 [Phytophthora infestans]|uniref:Uncharacterized protein n=1 Tax=Phytophthora infestans TaxID=4787 RepID=A0A8S9TZZ9_PHYIN|nr:hypothetical protein GN958_ATG16507 [Phytophthora infestans]
MSRWSSAIYSKYSIEPNVESDPADALLMTFDRGIGATTPELLELHKKHLQVRGLETYQQLLARRTKRTE